MKRAVRRIRERFMSFQRRLKIRTKIMLLYMTLSAVLLLILIPTVYSIVQMALEESLALDVQEAITNVSGGLYEEDGKVLFDEEKLPWDAVSSGIYVMITDDRDQIIYFSEDADWIFYELLYEEEERGEWSGRRVSVTVGDHTVYVTAVGNIYYNELLNNLVSILWFLVPGYMMIAAWGSYLLAKRALKPIHRITQTAQSIKGSDWSKRIEGIHSVDEVGELADTFNRMLDELEVSFQRERQFTSDASHELRTPMTVIRVCTDDALQTREPDIIRENLLMIKKENAKMTKMISQLLLLSRGYEGRQHFEPEDILLSDMVESVMEEFAGEAKEKSIEFHNMIAEQTLIYADQSLFTQLLMNLIGNAVKYGKTGGNIWIGVRRDADSAKLYIRDDGMGIAKEDREHIFERFYRADKARDRSGSGLGLSIVKWIAEMHGGQISVESRLGEGTVFYVTLPGGIWRNMKDTETLPAVCLTGGN